AAEKAMSREIGSALVCLQRQCWFESRTIEGLTFIDQLQSLIEQPLSHEELSQFTQHLPMQYWPHLLRTHIFNQLGDYSRASREVTTIGAPPSEPLSEHWNLYIRQLGILCAAAGRARGAFVEFEKDTQTAGQFSRGRVITEAWDDYAIWAMELGRFNLARDCYERALFISRERRIIWRIPYSLLCLSAVLIKVGDYQRAKNFFDDAITYDTEAPFLQVLKTTVAVELAQSVNDDSLLQRVLKEEAVELALRSGETRLIAAITAAFVKVAIARNQIQRARHLLSRAMNMI